MDDNKLTSVRDREFAHENGYIWEVWTSINPDAPSRKTFFKSLAHALAFANKFVWTSNNDMRFAEVYNIHNAYCLDYTRNLSCFSECVTDSAYLHLFNGACL